MSIALFTAAGKHELTGPLVTFGSAAENHLVISDDPRVAEQHGSFRIVQGKWMVEAVEGQLVRVGDGRPVKLAWLSTGDSVHLTESGPVIRFEVSDFRANLGENTRPTPPPVVVEPTRQLQKAFSGRNLLFGTASCLILAAILWVGLGVRVQRESSKSLFPGNIQISETTPEDSNVHTDDRLLEPADYLVLVGIGDLAAEYRPHVLSAGWLWNDRTAVVSRELGTTLEALLAATRNHGTPRQGCVLQGIPIEVVEIRHPERCSEVSLLMLKEPIWLPNAAKQQWRDVTAEDVERLRAKQKPLRYASFEQLPRSNKLVGKHDFSLMAYDPELVRPAQAQARLIYEGNKHTVRYREMQPALERGGLIVDDSNNILGMALLDATVVWTSELNKAFEDLKTASLNRN